MKQITYTGFYGHKNTGDDAFLEVTAYYSNKNNFTPYFLGDNLPELISPFKNLRENRFDNFKLNKINSRLVSIKPIVQSDYFLSAGGSTFGDHKMHGYKEISKYIKKYLNKNLKTGGIGVSIGPFKSVEAERRVIEYIKTLDFLAVRDKKSFEYLKTLALDFAPVEAFDLAALLPEIYNSSVKQKNNNEKIIGVSLCNYEMYYGLDLKNQARRNKVNIELLKNIANRDKSVKFRFFIFNGNSKVGDEKITLETIKESQIENYEIMNYQNNVKKAWDLIRECDFIISTRLHAAIFAAFSNVPFILNEYHRKCVDLLNDIEHNQLYIVGDAVFDVHEMSDIILNTINGAKEYIKPLKIQECISLAKRNFEFLK
ncbi:polysaccharide pyruvyl transferase family protein [Empedobacter sp. GD03739]|uniref:polysaccharide pyruvyl transferase family protein n=1 Tax=Empedobacter sp. GD03739 TaxID=2975376 RepID=UPI00244840C3|nr:polysaccharide pyruvyl transferase family protein [Empedobacter sp. GD03739]MDH1601213.1 polysaccharide pyruvyl transferase family protein [Empedobacter sp. GD03739]